MLFPNIKNLKLNLLIIKFKHEAIKFVSLNDQQLVKQLETLNGRQFGFIVVL